ncbi:VOC family protein [uncultured Ruminococcus sp.]
MLGFELAHIGINCDSESEALDVTSKFDKLFGWEQKNGNSSVFAGGAVECMKAPFKGAKGHIAVRTNSVRRAVYQLAHQGIEADMSTAKYDADGRMTVVYLKEDFGGFAVHLVEKK